MCTRMFTTTLFITAQKRKTIPIYIHCYTDKNVACAWVIISISYKKNKVMIHTTA